MEDREIIELSLAYWRLKQWVDKVEVEKKRAAYSALRRIEAILSLHDVQLLSYDGQQYTIGLPVSVEETTEDLECDGAIIQRTLEPVIRQGQRILHYGIVRLTQGE
jgi:hypothetical protein